MVTTAQIVLHDKPAASIKGRRPLELNVYKTNKAVRRTKRPQAVV